MKKILISSAIIFAFMFIGSTEAYSQAERKVLKANKVESSRGSSKYVRPTTDIPAPAPSKTRGTTYDCCLDFDNWTGYIIDVWVDEVYRGRVSPYDNDSLCVTEGWTEVYCETVGGTYWWSDEGFCSGFYTFKIE